MEKKETNKSRVYIKFFSGFISILFIIILFMNGSAQAFILGLVTNDNEIVSGEKIRFNATINVEDGEYLDINYFSFKLNGPEKIECKFNRDGSKISGCDKLTIKKISSPGHYYGYGYFKGEFFYEITIDSSELNVGRYQSRFSVVLNNKEYTKSSTPVTIIKESDITSLHCSVRASRGELIIEDDEFGRSNEINFYIPIKDPKKGRGYLIGQKERERFQYKFNVLRVLENSPERLIIETSGNCKIGIGPAHIEKSIIYYDKKLKTIDVIGDRTKIEDMKVSFVGGC